MHVHDCIVIGAGQTGLATGYKLKQADVDFKILESRHEISGSFGSYYDSLKLFTPVPFSQLPGYKMKQDRKHYPTRDEFIEYLQNYASHFDLPVVTSTKVTRVEKSGTLFEVKTDNGGFHTRTVVNASGPYSEPVIPNYPNQEQFSGQILHSYAYKNASGFEGKNVVVVGAGNSALQIAIELKDIATVTVATRRKIKWVNQKILGLDIHWWMHTCGIDHFPLRNKPKGGIPVIDIGGYRAALKRKELLWKPMFKEFTSDGVVWSDGTEEPVDVVLYATGYQPKLDWLNHFPVIDSHGEIMHRRGISQEVPGLFFAGLFLQRNAASGNVRGAGYDAEFIVRRVLNHIGERNASAKKDAWQVALRQRMRKMD